MKRFSPFLILGALMVLLLAGCSDSGGPAPSAGSTPDYPTPEKPITLKLGYDPPPKEITDLAANEFKRLIEEETKGAVKIQLYPQNQLGSMKAMMDGVLSGTIDMTGNPWNMLTTVMPEFNVMILPFNIDTIDLYWAVLGDEAFRKKINELVNKKGLEFIGVPNGITRGLITTSAVKMPSDLKGLKVRVMDGPIYTDMFTAWGATTSVISFAECYTGLQQGVIDSVDNDPGMGVLMKFFEVAKYYTPTNHIIHGCPIFINLGVWNKLSPEQQAIMKSAGQRMEKFSADTYPEIDKVFWKRGSDEYGVTYIDFDAETRKVWVDLSQPVYEKYRNVIGPDFYDWFIALVDAKREELKKQD
ncbi:MAG: TRAP transporter substrate-binding protein [Candidatus Adiutrix sp.]|jgi:tripartite ATP-independent transporter DctP family solute receptor|nr:TRAP transporter substrate-binding protein [Candidatus Adiutrix sp.]